MGSIPVGATLGEKLSKDSFSFFRYIAVVEIVDAFALTRKISGNQKQLSHVIRLDPEALMLSK